MLEWETRRNAELDRLSSSSLLPTKTTFSLSSNNHRIHFYNFNVSALNFDPACFVQLIRSVAGLQIYCISAARCRLAPAREAPALIPCHHCDAFISHDTIGSTTRRWLAIKVPTYARTHGVTLATNTVLLQSSAIGSHTVLTPLRAIPFGLQMALQSSFMAMKPA